jgi:hypothetical protein
MESFNRTNEIKSTDTPSNIKIPEALLKIPESDIPPWEREPVSIRDAYGDTIADTINDIVEGPGKDIQVLWNNYKDDVLIFDPSYDGWGAWYDPEAGAVTINIETCREGDFISPPYEVAFHEFGHNIDHKINQAINGDDGYLFSETFNDGLLGKTAKEEAAAYIESCRLEMETKDGRPVSYNEACERLGEDLQDKLPWKERADLSDIFEGATNGDLNLGAGHGKEYWNYVDNGIEIFAEMFSASICNKGSLNTIKEYFPKTYEVFKEIVRTANEQA